MTRGEAEAARAANRILIDRNKIEAARLEKGLSREELAEKAHISVRTYDRVLENKAPLSTVKIVAQALGKELEDFFLEDETLPISPHRVRELARILRIAVVFALDSGQYSVDHPYLPAPPTRPVKITDRVNDLTEPVDEATSQAIQQVLLKAFENEHSVLLPGFRIFDEETGVTEYPQGLSSSNITTTITIDAADDTVALNAHIGGTVLVSLYEAGVGWVCAVAADFYRRRLYSCIAGNHTHALQLPLVSRSESPPKLGAEFPSNEPVGQMIDLRPSGKKSTQGASVNLYMGKPYRVVEAVEKGRRLLDEAGIDSIFSFGGSRGPLLVAEGLIDASVEYMRGFRRLDMVPGALIAKQAGCHVCDLTGREISFGVDREFEKMLALPVEREKSLERLRQKFICAATPELAHEIVSKLN